MPEKNENKNQYVTWKIFLGLATITIVIVGASVTLSRSALEKASANELKINTVEVTENIHYEEVQKSLGRIENNVNDLVDAILKKN